VVGNGRDIVLVNKYVCIGAVLGATTAAACTTSSHILLGQARPPVAPGDVRIYLEPIAGNYEKIAVIDASSGRSFSWTSAAKAEVVLTRLKEEAARLGANGVVLEEITAGTDGSFGAAAAPDVTRDHASIGVGLSATGLFATRHGRGVAVYVAASQ
jgi:hypothetical protein